MSKINLFEDKQYDSLDWLNKAVESFNFPPNDVLAAMPEVFEFDFDTILAICLVRRALGINMEKFVSYAAAKAGVELGQARILVEEHYRLEADAVLDFEERTLTGHVRIVKTKSQLSDEDIVELLASKTYERLRYISYDKAELSRLNEVLDLIGAKETRSSRSSRHKSVEIAETMAKIVKEDKWRVRDYELMLKCTDWIRLYVEDGNLAAMSNFTRLKCMVHKGVPIYSMEETK